MLLHRQCLRDQAAGSPAALRFARLGALASALLAGAIAAISGLALAFEPVDGMEFLLTDAGSRTLVGYGRIEGGVLELEIGPQEHGLRAVVIGPDGRIEQFGASIEDGRPMLEIEGHGLIDLSLVLFERGITLVLRLPDGSSVVVAPPGGRDGRPVAGEPGAPTDPEPPLSPGAPRAPDQPGPPTEPEAPEPELPEAPDAPAVPDAPDAPEAPEAPDAPDVPEVPDESETPDLPDVPAAPDLPEVPEVPEVPEAPLPPIEAPLLPDEEENDDDEEDDGSLELLGGDVEVDGLPLGSP